MLSIFLRNVTSLTSWTGKSRLKLIRPTSFNWNLIWEPLIGPSSTVTNPEIFSSHKTAVTCLSPCNHCNMKRQSLNPLRKVRAELAFFPELCGCFFISWGKERYRCPWVVLESILTVDYNPHKFQFSISVSNFPSPNSDPCLLALCSVLFFSAFYLYLLLFLKYTFIAQSGQWRYIYQCACS